MESKIASSSRASSLKTTAFLPYQIHDKAATQVSKAHFLRFNELISCKCCIKCNLQSPLNVLKESPNHKYNSCHTLVETEHEKNKCAEVSSNSLHKEHLMESSLKIIPLRLEFNLV